MTRELVLLWHIHQPFFVPDEEVREQVVRSYRPLLELHRSLEIPFGLNVCGRLLERLAVLAPDWVELLQEELAAGRVELLGSGASHPLLPLLPHARARAQVVADLKCKESVLSTRPVGFWPTDLGWSHWLVPILSDAGLSWTTVDSSAVVAASILPAWESALTMGQRVLSPELSPLVASTELGRLYRLKLGDASLFALPRHSERTWDLVDRREGVLHDVTSLESALIKISEHYDAGASLLVIGEDGERVHPQTVTAYQRWIEGVQERGISFVNATDAVESRAKEAREIYLPTSTALVDLSAWLTTPDDWICFRQVDEVERRFDDLMRRRPKDPRLSRIQAAMLDVEDSGFYFWKFARRTREPFFERLEQIRRALDSIEGGD